VAGHVAQQVSPARVPPEGGQRVEWHGTSLAHGAARRSRGLLTSIGAATVAVATTAQALDVSLETAPGEAIPVVGFGRLTLFFTVIGVLIARTIGRRARKPRSSFIRTTLVLTALPWSRTCSSRRTPRRR